MNKYIVCVVSLLVGLGLGYQVFHNGAKPQPVEPPLGGVVETDASHFVNGFYAGTTDQFSVNDSGTLSTSGTLTATTVTASLLKSATVGSSSSSPASLGSAVAGHFIVATGSTTANASTTAVTANSSILVTQEETTPIAGTTCNATTTAISVLSKTAHATNGGFRVSVETAPGVSPICVAYLIIN